MSSAGGFDAKQVYDAAAENYESASRDYWQYLAARTVERLDLRSGERVLDVPCGTGPALLPAGRLVGPAGRVVGLDVADRMLAIARSKVEAAGLSNVSVGFGDMTDLPAPAEPYDVVLCVLGIFFVDDMPAVLRSLAGVVRPGGRVAVTVFGERVFDPLRAVFVDAVASVAPGLEVVLPWQRTHRMDTLLSVFAGAGLPPPAVHTEDDTLPLPSEDDWWRIVLGSGLRRAVDLLGPERAALVRARCAAHIAEHGVDQIVNRSRYAVVERPSAL
ncbi:MAG TPA: methyltransferase domain-containing protein [Acidimicrobiales bacterium]|nr:methyltransferase domain-containing protein [Acidimicrobiales bacterium]